MDSRKVAFRLDGITYLCAPDGALTFSADVLFWRNASDALEWARGADVRAIFMLDGYDLDLDWWQATRPHTIHTTAPAGVEIPTVGRVGAHYNDRRYVWLYNVYKDTRWAPLLDDLPEIRAMYATVLEFEAAMGAPVSYSPANMALDLLRPDTVRKPAWFEYPTIPHHHPISAAAHHMDAGALDSGYRWLHSFDVAAAHLAASTGVEFGCGALTHLKYGAAYAVDERAAGILRVEIGAPMPELRRRGWYDARFVRAVQKWYPGNMDVTEAWTFSDKHQSLRPWAERLWRARQRTTGTARALVKAAYTAALGRMDHRGRSNTHYRPLWYSAIVAETARRSWARWHWAEIQPNRAPLYLWSDAIGILTDDPSFESAIPVGDGSKLGALRWTGSVYIGNERGAGLVTLIRDGRTVKLLEELGGVGE